MPDREVRCWRATALVSGRPFSMTRGVRSFVGSGNDVIQYFRVSKGLRRGSGEGAEQLVSRATRNWTRRLEKERRRKNHILLPAVVPPGCSEGGSRQFCDSRCAWRMVASLDRERRQELQRPIRMQSLRSIRSTAGPSTCW